MNSKTAITTYNDIKNTAIEYNIAVQQVENNRSRWSWFSAKWLGWGSEENIVQNLVYRVERAVNHQRRDEVSSLLARFKASIIRDVAAEVQAKAKPPSFREERARDIYALFITACLRHSLQEKEVAKVKEEEALLAQTVTIARLLLPATTPLSEQVITPEEETDVIDDKPLECTETILVCPENCHEQEVQEGDQEGDAVQPQQYQKLIDRCGVIHSRTILDEELDLLVTGQMPENLAAFNMASPNTSDIDCILKRYMLLSSEPYFQHHFRKAFTEAEAAMLMAEQAPYNTKTQEEWIVRFKELFTETIASNPDKATRVYEYCKAALSPKGRDANLCQLQAAYMKMWKQIRKCARMT